MWGELLRPLAQITREQASKMESNCNRQIANGTGTRTLTLGSLTRTGKQPERAFGRRATRTTR